MDILPVHTGWLAFDIIVYIVSGGAFIGICFLLPRFLKDQYARIRAELELWLHDNEA